MLKKYLILFLISCFHLCPEVLLAQHELTGKVIDKAQNPVSFANVILLNATDSTSVYRGAVTSDTGTFIFQDVEPNAYLLKVSFVGFEDYLEKINVPRQTSLDPIVLEENMSDLEEVSINYVSPTIKREVDRIVFNVENSSLTSGTTWDILKRTPGVIVSNNSLQVRNQGVQVYINDRKVQLTQSELKTLLENYSGDHIVSVEVITTPPARYDAEGGAILNIITSKTITPGYKGNLNGSYTQAIFPKFSVGTSHYYKTEKINLFANYTFSPKKEFKEDESYINFRDNGIISRWETDFDRTTRSQAHNANLILDYQLNSKNTLSLATSFTGSPDRTFANRVHTTIEDDISTTPGHFLTESGVEEDLTNFAADLEYRHSFDSPGSELSLKAHLTEYSQGRTQDVHTFNFFSAQDPEVTHFSTDAQQDIRILNFGLDYTTPIGGTSLETGLKTSLIDSESGIAYDSPQDQQNPVAGVSDLFFYDEHVFAGYVSMSKDWEKWSVKGGLRGEYTDRTGISRSMDQEDQAEDLNIFPTIFIQHVFSPSHSLTFDYSRRIQRPRYESLNPFRYYLNEYDYNAGNPDLRSAISDNFNLNYTLKQQYFFDLYYRNNGGFPETISFQDNELFTLRRVSVNVLESISYGLDISHGRSLANWWYAYGYVSLFHEEQDFLALESNNARVTNAIDAVYGSLYNSFTLTKDGSLTGDLTLTYVSDWITGSYNFEPMTTLSIGLRKTFWDNRAEMTLNLADILDQTNTWLTSRYLNQDNAFYAQPESRYVRVGFKYNFGNFRLRDNQREIEAAERDRL